MHANKEMPVEDATAGHIYAMIGLKDTTTGDTLCASDANQIVLESMSFPDPVINVSIEPKTKSDQEKLGTAIQKLAEEDPDLLGQARRRPARPSSGMGELHLDILVDRMRREFKVEANVGKPQVAYRETIRRVVDPCRLHPQKQTGGSGQFAKGHRRSNRWSTPRTAPPTSSSMPSPVVAFRASTSVGGCGCTGRDAVRRARRLPAGEPEGDAARRSIP